MAKSCLVLAYVDQKDLPPNYKEFDVIDAYGGGFVDSMLSPDPARVRLHPDHFLVGSYESSAQPYSFCYIRHPDPQLRPASWISAIAAIGKCLDGELLVRFYYAYEILHFDAMINMLLGGRARRTEIISGLASDVEDSEYAAKWEIKPTGKNMRALLRLHERDIVQRIKHGDLSQLALRNGYISLEEVLRRIKGQQSPQTQRQAMSSLA